MTTLQQIVFAFVLVFALLATAAAQDSTSPSAQRSSLTITAAAAGDRVRMTAPSSVVQMHVEVYASSGEKLFDQEIRGGNVFDWHLQDGQAQRLAPGNYVCVVTAKSISGRLTQKIGTVSVEEKSASVHAAESQQLSAPQAQTIGPVEENSSWTIAAPDEPQTGTVIANDGTDGQMIRGRGALTFRIGNFFSGNDQEQVRLTEDGRLGIGTSDPQAKLDVAGTIRAQRFLVAKPNKPASDIKAQATDAADSVQPLIAGTGTQDRVAKWTDNAGTLGDSAITEIGGNVGIGTTTPGSKLVVSANTAPLPPASGVARFADADGGQTAVFADAFSNNAIFNVRRANGTAASPSALQANQLIGVIGASGYGASAYMGTRARVAFWASEIWTNTANGTYLTFNTTANGAATPGGTERMRIDNSGNVGIGTVSPGYRLHVIQQAANTYGGHIQTSGLAAGSSFGLVVSAGTNANDASFNARNQGGTSMFMVRGDGNVGIGTTDPVGRLNIVGSDGAVRGIQIDNREIKFRGDTDAHYSIFANRIPGTFTIEDTSSNFNVNTPGTVALAIAKGSGNVGIGTTSPGAALEVRRDATVASNWQTGQLRISGASNPNMQLSLGYDTSSNLGVIQAGQAFTAFRNLSLNPFGGNVAIGTTSDPSRLRVEQPAGAYAAYFRNSSTVAGQSNGLLINAGTTPYSDYAIRVRDKTDTVDLMSVQGNGFTTVDALIVRNISFSKPLGVSGNFPLCLGPGLVIDGCSSSSLRYKTNVGNFRSGLDVVTRLRPITFDWKQDGRHDFGLGAEEVEKVDPNLVFYLNGKIEGVKYDRIGVVLINAVKEQQAQIHQQQEQLKQQRFLIEQQALLVNNLRRLVCRRNARAAICRR